MTAPAFELYDIPRRCRLCGHEWVGQSFTPPAEGEALPRPGCCDACSVAADERAREMMRGPVVKRTPTGFTTALPEESVDTLSPMEREEWWHR